MGKAILDKVIRGCVENFKYKLWLFNLIKMGDGSNNIGWVIMLIYLLLAAYFINVAFVFYDVPEFITNVNKWISLVAGIFLIWGAINYKRSSNRI